MVPEVCFAKIYWQCLLEFLETVMFLGRIFYAPSLDKSWIMFYLKLSPKIRKQVLEKSTTYLK